MRRPKLSSVAATFAIVVLATATPGVSYAATFFEGLGFLPGGDSSIATGISGNGSVVVGYAGSAEAFSWTKGTMTGLGALPNATVSQAFGTNRNGSVVVGMSYYSFGGAPNYAYQAFSSVGGTMTGLGFLPGGANLESQANAVSANGSVIVGWSNATAGASTPGDRVEAFSSVGGVMTGLGFLPGGYRSVATATSANGSVIVGWGNTASSNQEAFIWKASTGMVGIAGMTQAVAVSANGRIVDGTVTLGNGDVNAVSWRGGTITDLGDFTLKAMDARGSVVGGTAPNGDAVLWSAATGVESVQDLLMAEGDWISGWDLDSVTGISANGKIITGIGTDPSGDTESWIADIGTLRAAPIPAALPLFATGLGAIGLFGWRRKRKAASAAA